MSERWLPVPGFPNYQVSDHGRVWSRRRKGAPGGVLKERVDRNGYTYVTLYDPEVRSHRGKIHLLVMRAFVGPRPDGMETRHLDGNPRNNRLTNLAYGTRIENRADTIRMGNDHQLRKTHCPQGHPYDEANTIRRYGMRYCRACHKARTAARKARAVA